MELTMESSIAFLTQNLIIPLFHEKSLDVIDQFFTEEVDVKTSFIMGKGPEILKQSLQNTFEIFSNLHVIINDATQEGNKYTYQWQAMGLHAGAFKGVLPTRKNIIFSGVVCGEMQGKYITKYHSFSNVYQVLQSLDCLRAVQAANASSVLENTLHLAGNGQLRTLNTASLNAHLLQAASLDVGYSWQLDTTEDLEELHDQSKVSLIGSAKFKGNSALADIYHKLKKLTRFPLTLREFECLGTWIKGCSIKESARRMGGLSERTIQTYRESIKKKFGVCSYQQVLYIIKNNGLLPHLL